MKLHDTIGKEHSKTSMSLSKGKESPLRTRTPQRSPRKQSRTPAADCRIPRANSTNSNTGSRFLPSSSFPSRSMEETSISPMSSPRQIHTSPSPNRNSSRHDVPSSPACSTIPLTNKSESSSVTNTGTFTKSEQKTKSGIPRMASPRPLPKQLPPSSSHSGRQKEPIRKVNGELPPSPSKPARQCNNVEPMARVTSPSRLPVRRNVTNAKQLTTVATTRPVGAIPFRQQVALNKQLNITNGPDDVSSKPKVGGKDEGYSTMSSEALAEQEDGNHSTIILGSTQRAHLALNKGESSSKMHKSNTFNTFSTTGDKSGIPRGKFITRVNNINNKSARVFTSLPNTKAKEPEPQKPLETQPAVSTKCANVRIIRGTPNSALLPDDDGDENSTSTILWEDSDDSDVLFLPVEMSSNESCSSRSTLVHEKGATEPWIYKHSPKKQVKHERTVTTNNNNELIIPEWAECSADREEKALIEKWRKLERVKNEDAQPDEDWAWDWDGVERTATHPMLVNYNVLKCIRETALDGDDEADEEEQQPCWMRPLFSQEKCDIPTQIDSSTWTKKKRMEGENKCGDVANTTVDAGQLITNGERDANMSTVSRDTNNINDDDQEDDSSPPPVIEFTPEYYRLVNYEGNLSCSDNEMVAGQQQRVGKGGMQIISSPNNSRVTKKCKSLAVSSMASQQCQTDFNSSAENLTVSSELFTECRNCLEVIKKLVSSTSIGVTEELTPPAADSDHVKGTYERKLAELTADKGCPTTWISIPKGLPNSEVCVIVNI